MALIKCENTAFAYDGKTVLRELNFEVNTGDYLCVVGENGSGKSTLVKGILGLITPISGKIIYGDGLKQNEIGYLPQQTVIQKDFPASVFEVVISGTLQRRGMRPFYSKVEKDIAAANMEKLGITEYASRCYRELSGGQQQRVLLARALCATRKLLLLDEPVTGLDPVVSAEMYRVLEEINKDGITVIMVSHDVETASKSATHILHIRHKPLFFGEKDKYIASKIGQTFLGGWEDFKYDLK